MLLRELFEDIGSGDMITGLRQQVLDYLIPMVSHDVDFVTVQDIETMLRDSRTGLTIDRGLVMQILDPTKVKMVKKVEGDKVYLSVEAGMTANTTDQQQEKQADDLNNKATQQAVKSIKDK
jgi:hypothetical protein